MEGDSAENDLALIKIHVKFNGRTLKLSVSPDSTIKDVKSSLQNLTNVLPRGQKLIFKGKILDDPLTLRSLQVVDGAKVMLMASHGLYQGDDPITNKTSASFNSKRADNSKETVSKDAIHIIDKKQVERWRLTGIIGLSNCQLKAVPLEIWTCGPSIRVLDLSNNSILEVSANIGSLVSLNKLWLNANHISDENISWEGITSLRSLKILSLRQNLLTTLPAAIGALTSLKELDLEKNKLTCVPVEIGHLHHLHILKLSKNRITSLPSSIGDCGDIVELDVSSNLLMDLPESLGNLKKLKVLCLSNNGLKTLPSTIFKNCVQLSTLDLHNTEITMDFLCQIDGWKDFDDRRRLKHQKQLDFRVGTDAGFDEGADRDHRW